MEEAATTFEITKDELGYTFIVNAIVNDQEDDKSILNLQVICPDTANIWNVTATKAELSNKHNLLPIFATMIEIAKFIRESL